MIFNGDNVATLNSNHFPANMDYITLSWEHSGNGHGAGIDHRNETDGRSDERLGVAAGTVFCEPGDGEGWGL